MKTWIPDARNFAYLTWKQVDALPRELTLLILPTAAIEQHGHHLPLATDTLCNNLLLGKALELVPEELPIFALPPRRRRSPITCPTPPVSRWWRFRRSMMATRPWRAKLWNG